MDPKVCYDLLFNIENITVNFKNLVNINLSLPQNFFFFFVFLCSHLQHMEVPRLGVRSELQLPAYVTTIATCDLSCVATYTTAHLNSQILNLLSGAMEIEPASSWILVEFVTSELGGELPRIILFSFIFFFHMYAFFCSHIIMLHHNLNVHRQMIGLRRCGMYIYNGILPSHKKNKIMPFAATWMELDTLILSEVSQNYFN